MFPCSSTRGASTSPKPLTTISYFNESISAPYSRSGARCGPVHKRAAEKGLPQPAPSLLSLPREEKINESSQLLCRVLKAGITLASFKIGLFSTLPGLRRVVESYRVAGGILVAVILRNAGQSLFHILLLLRPRALALPLIPPPHTVTRADVLL